MKIVFLLYSNYILNIKPHLTEIVRQAKDNPIIKDATLIRECIFNRQYGDCIDNLFKNCNIFTSEKEFIREYIKLMMKDDDIILGTFTNRNVDFFNNGFRSIDYKNVKDIPNIMIDETIIANSAYIRDNTVIIPNNSDVHIRDSYIDYDDNGLKSYFCNVYVGNTPLTIKIIHESNEKKITGYVRCT